MMSKKIRDEELLEALQSRLEEFRGAIQNQQDLQKQLSNVNKKLEEAEAFKSHFIARISNEIINPFTTIITIADNLLKSDLQEKAETRRMVEHIYNEAFFLDFQLRNLFTAAKIEAGEIEKEIVITQPLSLIDTCVESFEQEFERKGLTLDKQVMPANKKQFKTDPGKVKLIMTNLISNAIKYSKEKSRIDMKADISNSVLYFSIENTGDQISDEQREVIFDRFRQLDTRIHSLNPGSGIGLSICKELTETLDGSIVSKNTDRGMKFTVKIPESDDPIEGFDASGDDLFFDDSNASGEIL